MAVELKSAGGFGPGRSRRRAQGSLFDGEVDLDAVRASLGIEACFRVAMEVREGMLRTSKMYRELPPEVFDRAASRRIDERMSEIGRERGLFVGAFPPPSP